MIDNKSLITPLLSFEKEGDFYMLYIFLRRKDHLDGDGRSNHQSVRTIKSYCIHSIEELESRWEEIKKLCELFEARAYIHIQAQNHETIGLNMIEEIAIRLKDGGNNFKHIFDSVVGQIKFREKRWIIDLDKEHLNFEWGIIHAMNQCLPISNKVITIIPTRNGRHLITIPFDTKDWKDRLVKLGITIPDLQKKNPTLLYYPNSLP